MARQRGGSGAADEAAPSVDAWSEADQRIIVSQPAAGFLYDLILRARIDAAPDAVYAVLTHPHSHEIFRGIRDTLSRTTLEDDGTGRRKLRVGHRAVTKFLWISVTFDTELFVWEDDTARTIRFTNARSDGFMKKFDGMWVVQPMTQDTLDRIYKAQPAAAAAAAQAQAQRHHWLSPAGALSALQQRLPHGRQPEQASLVTLEQALAPRARPPGPVAHLVRGLCARVLQNMMADLRSEVHRRAALAGPALGRPPPALPVASIGGGWLRGGSGWAGAGAGGGGDEDGERVRRSGRGSHGALAVAPLSITIRLVGHRRARLPGWGRRRAEMEARDSGGAKTGAAGAAGCLDVRAVAGLPESLADPLSCAGDAAADPEIPLGLDCISFDDALSKYIGEAGRGQLAVYVAASLLQIPNALIILLLVFSLGGNPSADPAAWACVADAAADPACAAARRAGDAAAFCALRPKQWAWAAPGASLATRFGLVCGRAGQAQLANSAFFLGYLIGSGAWGAAADARGAAAESAAGTSACRRPQRCVDRPADAPRCARCALRALRRAVRQVFFIAGEFVLVAIGTLPSWRAQFAAGAAVCAASLALWPLVPESPRWLFVQGRSDEAMQVLGALARRNGTRLPPMPLAPVGAPPPPGGGGRPGGGAAAAPPRLTLRAGLADRHIARRFFILAFAWFTCCLAYYGISFALGALGGVSLAASFSVAAAAELPSYLLAAWAIERAGRHNTMAAGMLLGGVACVTCGAVRGGAARAALAAVAKFGIAGSFGIAGVYTRRGAAPAAQGRAAGRRGWPAALAGAALAGAADRRVAPPVPPHARAAPRMPPLPEAGSQRALLAGGGEGDGGATPPPSAAGARAAPAPDPSCVPADEGDARTEYLTIESRCPDDAFNWAVFDFNATWAWPPSGEVFQDAFFANGWATTVGAQPPQQLRPRPSPGGGADGGSRGQGVAVLRVSDSAWVRPRLALRGGAGGGERLEPFGCAAQRCACVLVGERGARPFPRFRIVGAAGRPGGGAPPRLLANSVAAPGVPIFKGAGGVRCDAVSGEGVLGLRGGPADPARGVAVDAFVLPRHAMAVNYVALCWGLGSVVAVAFAAYAFAFGVLWARRHAAAATDTELFLTARGTQSVWRIGWSFFAGAVGAWVIVAPSQYASFSGIVGLVVYALASGIPIIIIAGFGALIKDMPHVLSLSDFMSWRYGPVAKTVVFLLCVFNMAIALLAEYTTIGAIFGEYVGSVSWGIIVLIGALTLCYTAYGGLAVSIATDQAQGVCALLLTVVLTIYVAVTYRTPIPSPLPDPLGPTFAGYVAIFTLGASLVSSTMFSEAVWQRVWASATPAALHRGAAMGCGLIVVVVFLSGFGGWLALVGGFAGPDTNPNTILMQILSRTPGAAATVDNWVGVVVVLLAIVMNEGAVDSLQNGLAASISSHYLKNRPLLWTRAAVVLLNVPLVIIGTRGFAVLNLFLVGNLLTCCAILPLIAGLVPALNRVVSETGFVLGTLGGVLGVTASGIAVNWAPGDVAGSFATGANWAWYGNNYDWRAFVAALASSAAVTAAWSAGAAAARAAGVAGPGVSGVLMRVPGMRAVTADPHWSPATRNALGSRSDARLTLEEEGAFKGGHGGADAAAAGASKGAQMA
ncbi:OCT4 [Scenedesmus sp. PABB004]|nr:OCT4 [Scenedesmus sp. PABB004]